MADMIRMFTSEMGKNRICYMIPTAAYYTVLFLGVRLATHNYLNGGFSIKIFKCNK